MNARSVVTLFLAAAIAGACGPDDLSGPRTGLSGVVLRGPTQPVCHQGDPCDEPFAAGFTLRLGSVVVRHFDSDGEGRFSVEVPPGSYTTVPDPDAPILAPESQPIDVTVEESGFTEVELRFDTGIR